MQKLRNLNFLEVISIKLKDKRKEIGFSQLDVAAYCGVKRSTVSKWETGVCLPRSDRLPALAKLYGCSVDELLNDGRSEYGIKKLS